MKYSVSFDEDDNFFRVKATGSAVVELIHEMVKSLVEHEQWHVGVNTLLDFSEVNFSCLDTDEIVQLSNIVKALSEQIGDGQCAMVTNQQVDFGLARMWQMMTEHHVEFQVEIYNSLTDAVEWLGTQSMVEH